MEYNVSRILAAACWQPYKEQNLQLILPEQHADTCFRLTTQQRHRHHTAVRSRSIIGRTDKLLTNYIKMHHLQHHRQRISGYDTKSCPCTNRLQTVKIVDNQKITIVAQLK